MSANHADPNQRFDGPVSPLSTDDVARKLTEVLDGQNMRPATALSFTIDVILDPTSVSLVVAEPNSDASYLLIFGLNGSGPGPIMYGDGRGPMVERQPPFAWQDLLRDLRSVGTAFAVDDIARMPRAHEILDLSRERNLLQPDTATMSNIAKSLLKIARGHAALIRLQEVVQPEPWAQLIPPLALANADKAEDRAANQFAVQLGKMLVDHRHSVNWLDACGFCNIPVQILEPTAQAPLDAELNNALAKVAIDQLTQVTWQNKDWLVVALELNQPGRLIVGAAIEPEKIKRIALAEMWHFNPN